MQGSPSAPHASFRSFSLYIRRENSFLGLACRLFFFIECEIMDEELDEKIRESMIINFVSSRTVFVSAAMYLVFLLSLIDEIKSMMR